MQKVIRLFFAALSLLCVVTYACAQPICKVRTFRTENGLPASVISGITQSADNLIWVTTWNGLSCYDGYRFTTFRNLPGHDSQLTTNHLVSVMPSENGNLWTTAYTGDVYLFDSRNCQYVNISAVIAKKFPNKFTLRKIYPLANGNAWIVGKYNDHYRLSKGYPIDTEKLEHFSLPSLLSKVLLDKHHNEWLLCEQGAYLYEGKKTLRKVTNHWVDYVEDLGGFLWLVTKDGKLLRMRDAKDTPREMKLSTMMGKVNDVQALNGRKLVIACEQGVMMYDVKTGKNQLLSVQWPGNPLTSVDVIYQDSRHRLWCFNKGNGVTMIMPDTHQVHLSAVTEGNMFTFADKPIFHEDSRHTLWMAPKNGAFSYYDEARQVLVPQSMAKGGNYGLVIPRVKSAYSDHQRNLWLVYPHNLSLVSFSYSNIQQIDLGTKRETRSVLQDHEGNILLGTVDGDVVKCSPSGKVLGYLSQSRGWQQSRTVFSDRVYSLYEDKRNRLWIGTKGQGLYCVDGDHITNIRFDEKNAYALNSNEIYDIKEDTKGRLLVATFNGGLNISTESIYSGKAPQGMAFLNSKNLLKGYDGNLYNKVRRIEALPNGIVLLATTQGLLTYSDKYIHPDRIRFYASRHTKADHSLYSSEVMQTLVTKNGKMYVVTLGGGLQCTSVKNLLQDNLSFDPVKDKSGEFVVQSYGKGMEQSLVAGNSGDLWVVGESRIICIGNKVLKEYGADELGDVNISEALPSHSTLTDRIVIATEGGAISFLPKDMDRSSYTPNIVFTSIRYMDNDEEQPILNMPRLTVDIAHRTFSLFFAAIDYSSQSSASAQGSSSSIRYAYKVDDENWTYVHPGSNNVSFNHFPPGEHTITVRSTNGDGEWMHNERQLLVYAEPTFLESWWGRTLLLLAGLTLALTAIRSYMRKRANEIKEEAVEKADASKVNFLLRKTEIVDEDKVFMDKLMEYIELHIGDAEMKVEDLAAAVGLGRSTFYTRLKQIADLSPNDFLRHVRMKKAEELVSDSSMTFSQIAYTVGFTDPKYFGKCFKKHTGMSPSEYRKETKKVRPE